MTQPVSHRSLLCALCLGAGLSVVGPRAAAVPLPLDDIINVTGTTDAPGAHFGRDILVRGADGRSVRGPDGRRVREYVEDIQFGVLPDDDNGGLRGGLVDLAEIEGIRLDDGTRVDRLIDADIFVTRRIDTLEDRNTYRLLDIFENVGTSDVAGTIRYETDLDSDGDETAILAEPDRLVSAALEDEPAVDGSPRLPVFYPVTAFAFGSGVDYGLGYRVDPNLDLTLAPGERFGFLQFVTLIENDADRSGDIARASAISGEFARNPDLTGLTSDQIASIRNFDVASVTVAAVPEPGTLALFGAGVFGMAIRRRRQVRSAS